MQIATGLMQQAVVTVNDKKNDNKTRPNSEIYATLKDLINVLPSDDASLNCKQLLEAIAKALIRGEMADNLVRRISGKRVRIAPDFSSLSLDQAQSDLIEIKKLRRLAHERLPVPGAKKLDRFYPEIVTLYKAKASFRDIQYWLLAKKRVVISHTTIQRYLKTILKHEQAKDASQLI